jgi:hypothetical protein
MNKTVKTVYPSLSDGRYDSEFPYRNASDDIESITHSIYKIYNVVFYTTYQFSQSTRLTRGDLRSKTFKRVALGIISTHESNSGTGTVIMNDKQRIALLTCAHVLEAIDTLVSVFPISADDPVEYVKSVSIVEKQEIYVKDISECGNFFTLVSDPVKDIAIIGKKCEGKLDSIETFNYPAGHANELEWGSFVYIFGYPMGNLMVTKGIVSNPKAGNLRSFTVDALLNKGFSGGLILAIRDGVPNFELVGMVKSISSRQNYFLKPEKELYEKHYSEVIPYTGGIYTGVGENINYGINYVISIEELKAFYQKNRDILVSQGYNLDHFFH